MTQKNIVLTHLKAGKTISQWESTKKYSILRLAPIIHELRKEGWPIADETKSARNGNGFKIYWLDLDKEHPREPSLFDVDGDAGKSPVADTVDTSATALRPENPPEVYRPEVRPHHVANPNDGGQIFRTFREHCAKSGGRRVTIEPGMARELLKLNWASNRPINEATVERYAAEMKAGEWKYNGDQISLDEKQRLLQGQHRLAACVRADVPLVTDVAFDVDPDSYATMDRGRPKSGADIARYEGVEEHHSAHSAAVKILFRYDAGLEFNAKLSSEQERKAHRRYRDAAPWVKAAVSMRFGKVKGIKGPTGLLAALLYLCARIDPGDARQFAKELEIGVGGVLHARHPSFIAHRMVNEKGKFLGYNGYTEYRRIISKAWEHRRKGVEVSHFKPSSNDPEWPVGSRRPWDSDHGSAQAAE
jgi:hypothetical protein